MTIDYATGEIVEYDRAAAERRAERIRLRLDTIADNLTAVLPMIREAIAQRDDIALGYRSPGEYVADRFGRALSGLGIEVRRAVVGELTEAGLSTRAIAPVVGVNNATVHRDLAAGVAPATPQTPAPEEGEAGGAGPHVSADSAGEPEGEDAPEGIDLGSEQRIATGGATPAAPRPPVIGIDGKTYSRPEPKPTPKPARSGEQQNAEENSRTLASSLIFLLAFQHPNQRDTARIEWEVGRWSVPPTNREYVTPDRMRTAARGLLALADEWENTHE